MHVEAVINAQSAYKVSDIFIASKINQRASVFSTKDQTEAVVIRVELEEFHHNTQCQILNTVIQIKLYNFEIKLLLYLLKNWLFKAFYHSSILICIRFNMTLRIN